MGGKHKYPTPRLLSGKAVTNSAASKTFSMDQIIRRETSVGLLRMTANRTGT